MRFKAASVALEAEQSTSRPADIYRPPAAKVSVQTPPPTGVAPAVWGEPINGLELVSEVTAAPVQPVVAEDLQLPAAPVPEAEPVRTLPPRAAEPPSGAKLVHTPDPEMLPPNQRRLRFPVPNADSGQISLDMEGDLITLRTQNASLQVVLSMIAEQMNLNLVSDNLDGAAVTVSLQQVPLQTALELILPLHGYTFSVQDGVLVVTNMHRTLKTDPNVQGREIRAFALNYIAAEEVLPIVEKLVSPVGHAFVHVTKPDNTRFTHEQIVVEDLPAYLIRIHTYLAQVDVPPRQVQVEANILQVTLQDNCRHGVDFDQMLRIANSEVTLESTGFTSTGGAAHLFRINGTDLTSVVDLLKTTTDAKTLASPKVTVLNGQQSRMQVGGQIGYLLTTTTQTSSLQSVNFLEYGVILTVTPIITDSGQVLIKVKPQVSTGRINSSTELPESETTEVETTVMLNDGEAMILGGLIKETDTETQNKVPWLGDLKYIGRIFQKRSAHRERNEVIITLLPRIVPDCGSVCEVDVVNQQRAQTPLLQGPLNRVDRGLWEAQLPDAVRGR